MKKNNFDEDFGLATAVNCCVVTVYLKISRWWPCARFEFHNNLRVVVSPACLPPTKRHGVFFNIYYGVSFERFPRGRRRFLF